MNEEAIQYGHDNHLVGVATLPASANGDVGVLLLNAGVIHHVGPYRAHVLLARAFAASGFTTLRLDLAGIGDSEWVTSQKNYSDLVVDDISAAMDMLQERYGLKRFVIIGICTGADNAHKVALADRRVAGAAFLDGYTYPTFKYVIKRTLPVLLNPRRLFTALHHHLWVKHRQRPEPSTAAAPADGVDRFDWLPPKRAQMAADLKAFNARELPLLFIYTGSWSDHYNYTSQMADAFKQIDFSRIDLEYWPHVDHTYFRYQDRQHLVQYLTDWLQTRFPASAQESHNPPSSHASSRS